MNEPRTDADEGPSVRLRRAVRIPLPDEAAELEFHRNMARVADAQERKASMLADPSSSVLAAYERQLEGITESYRTTLKRFAGEEYDAVARAYLAGDRTDRVAATAAYLLEAVWRLQEMYTVSEVAFFPVVLRYPRCCTLNLRFADAHATRNGVRYESPEHLESEPDEEYAESYYRDSQWSLERAAEAISASARTVREQFPDPRTTPFEERRTGGVAAAFGRRGSEFSTALERVEPDPDRFDDPPAGPELVAQSPVAERTEREWLPLGATVT